METFKNKKNNKMETFKILKISFSEFSVSGKYICFLSGISNFQILRFNRRSFRWMYTYYAGNYKTIKWAHNYFYLYWENMSLFQVVWGICWGRVSCLGTLIWQLVYSPSWISIYKNNSSTCFQTNIKRNIQATKEPSKTIWINAPYFRVHTGKEKLVLC